MRSQWPSKNQWGQFFRNPLHFLTKKEKIFFFAFLFLAVSSFLFLSVNFYFENTKIVPAKGGLHIEGVIGSPRFINPIYAQANDVDRDLTELIFSGLMKHGPDNKIIPDLVREYQVLEDGKIYEFYLKENLLWSDNKPLTADDIVFTVKAVQNPGLKSPIRAKWLGVKVEKISDLKIRFELKNPSPVFLENTTLKIMPKHIWQDISEQNFPLSIHNLKPIGSGPYKVKNISQDKQGRIESLDLAVNPNYANNPPYIPKITFRFFRDKTELIRAFSHNQITGFSLLTIMDKERDLKNKSFSEYNFLLPRYFAVFFNQEKSAILTDNKVREALNYGTDKQGLIVEVLSERAKIVNSPILPEIFGFEAPENIHKFNPEKAKQILETAGFVEGKEDGLRVKTIDRTPAFQFKSDLRSGSMGTEVSELQKCLAKIPEVYPEGIISGYFGDKTRAAVIRFQEKYKKEILAPNNLLRGTGTVGKSTRAKLNELCHQPTKETLALKLSLITVDQPLLIETANHLKNQWRKLGVELEIKTFDIASLEQKIIKTRNYEMLLFGNVLGAIPDPFPFWHSDQKKDPGLNLALYQNKKADKLLEQARQTLDEEERKKALEEFQNILIKDIPAIFLFNPNYLYLVSNEIKGINARIITDPSKRFSEIENWYIKTKRIWQ